MVWGVPRFSDGGYWWKTDPVGGCREKMRLEDLCELVSTSWRVEESGL
jgi:hypothetical protein